MEDVPTTASPSNSETSPLLQSLWDLASVDATLRMRAAASLLRAVSFAQREFEEAADKLGSLPTDVEDRPCCNDLSYATERLVKGLCSSRNGARQGFALALTEILTSFPNVHTSEVYAFLLSSSTATGRSSREEQRDGMLARVFGILALHRAGRLVHVTPGDVVVPAVLGEEEAEEKEGEPAERPVLPTPPPPTECSLTGIIAQLLYVARKKVWLADIAMEGVLAILQGAAGTPAWPAVAAAAAACIPASPRQWTPEHVTLALELDQLYVAAGVDALMLPAAVTTLRDALSVTTLQRYRYTQQNARGDEADADAMDEADDGAASSGPLNPQRAPLAPALLTSTRTYPQLHSVWAHLMRRFVCNGALAPAASSCSNSDAVAAFAETWRVYVDELLLPLGPERKATALALVASVAHAAAHAPALVLSSVLSPMIVRAMYKSLGSSRRLLHAPSHAARDAIVAACHGRAEAASVALVAFMARGHADFDRRTGTTTLSELLAQLDDAAILRHVTNAQREFARPSTAPVYSDMASTTTGFTALTAGDDSAENGSDEDEFDEDADTVLEEEEADRARAFRKARMLSPADMRRLWALDTITSALRNPALAVLHTPANARKLLSFLAVHAFADVEVPEALLPSLAPPTAGDAAAKPATTGKRARAAVPVPGVAQLQALAQSSGPLVDIPAQAGAASSLGACAYVVAEPPLGPQLRDELRTRITTLIRQLCRPPRVAGVAAPARGDDAPPARPMIPCPDIRDRAAASSHVMATLADTVNAAWTASHDIASAVSAADADADALHVALHPSAHALEQVHSSDDDEAEDDDAEAEGDDEDMQEDGDAAVVPPPVRVAPALVRRKCNDISLFLRALAEILLTHAGSITDKHAAASITNAGRHLLAMSALLSQCAVHILLQEDGAAASMSDVSAAVHDIIMCLPTLMHPVSSAVTALGVIAPSMANAAPTPKKGAKASKKAPAPHFDCLELLRAFPTQLVGHIGDEVRTRDGDNDMLVYVDAILSLLSASTPALRDAITASCRFAFGFISVDAMESLLEVVLQRQPTDAGNEDGDEDEHDAEDDEEDDPPRRKSKQARAAAAAATAAEEDEDEDAEDSEEEEEEEHGTDKQKAAKATAAAGTTEAVMETDEDASTSADASSEADAQATMSRYDSMLGNMLRLRRDSKAALKDRRTALQTFKFRALELVDVAVNASLTDTTLGRGDSRSHTLTPFAVLLLSPLLRCLQQLAKRAAVYTKSRAGEDAADDASRLLRRLTTSVAKITRARAPALATHAGDDDAASPQQQLLTLFTETAELLDDAPSPSFVDSCGGVLSLCLRALRVATPGTASNAQPAVQYIDTFAAGYAHVLISYFSSKHSRISPAVFAHAVQQVPAVSVRFLPTLCSLVTSNAAAKPFLLSQLIGIIASVLKTASASWTRDVACSYVAEEEERATAGASTPAHAPRAVITVSEYLRGVTPSVLDAAAHVLAACDAALISGGRLPLSVKNQREPLQIVSMILKQGLVRDGPEMAAALDAVAAFGSHTSADQLRVACNAVLTASGRDAVFDLSSTLTPVVAPVEEEEAVAQHAATEKLAPAAAQVTKQKKVSKAPVPAAAAASAAVVPPAQPKVKPSKKARMANETQQ